MNKFFLIWLLLACSQCPKVLAESDHFKEEGVEEDERISSPGIVANRDGKWLWSDHLFNLDKNIDVNVEITKPADVKLPYTEEELEAVVSAILKKAGINPVAMPPAGKPNLPMFHVLILVYPIRDGYTLSVNGRLFEAVNLTRVKLDESVTMQAITWDKASIHVVSGSKLKEELVSSIAEVTNDFVSRYEFFEKLRTK